MRAARGAGLPITVLLGYRKQDGLYTFRDRAALIAVQQFEDSICSGCHLPASVVRGDHNVGRIEVRDDVVCHGCQALESYQESRQDKPYPGQKTYTVVDWD